MKFSVWKDVLYPGRVVVPDGKGDPQEHIFTSDDIENACREMNGKVQSGYGVPVCWEHDDSATPIPLSAAAKRAKSTFGWGNEYRVDEEGVLQSRLDMDDEKDFKQLPKTRFVSPSVCWNWVDSTGKTWPGLTIQHIAVTPRPVQQQQKPFQLSHEKSAPNRVPATIGPIFLSLDHYVRLSNEEPDMAEETTTTETEAGGSNDKLKKLIDLCHQMGLKIGDDTTMDNICDRMTVAIETKMAHEGTDPEDDDDLDDEDDFDDEDDYVNPPSAEEQNTIGTSPTAPIGLSHEKQTPFSEAEKKAHQRWQVATRKELLMRVDRLQVARPLRESLAQKVQTVDLSMNAKGDLIANEVTIKLEAYEELPPRKRKLKNGKPVRLSRGRDRTRRVSVVDPPRTLTGEAKMTPEEQKKNVDWIMNQK